MYLITEILYKTKKNDKLLKNGKDKNSITSQKIKKQK